MGRLTRRSGPLDDVTDEKVQFKRKKKQLFRHERRRNWPHFAKFDTRCRLRNRRAPGKVGGREPLQVLDPSIK